VGKLLEQQPDRVVVVGGTESSGPVAQGPFDVRPFGTTRPRRRAGPGLPLSLGVGQMLLGECGWSGRTELRGVGWDAPASELQALADDLVDDPSGTGVLLLGEGSARRGDTAPGFLDDRAFGFDDAVATALAGGDAAALWDLDVDLARELMVGGRSVLRLLGRLGVPVRAELSYRDDPFGVSYFVATWTFG
jgi:hypothetical protein